jgi:hypothetical protein
MFGPDSEEKIFLIEPKESEYKTKLISTKSVSFGLIKVELVDALTGQHEITFIEEPKHDQVMDLVLEPFTGNFQRMFLYVYKEHKVMKGI